MSWVFTPSQSPQNLTLPRGLAATLSSLDPSGGDIGAGGSVIPRRPQNLHQRLTGSGLVNADLATRVGRHNDE